MNDWREEADESEDEVVPRYEKGDEIDYHGQRGVIEGYDPDRDRYFVCLDDRSHIRADRDEVDRGNR